MVVGKIRGGRKNIFSNVLRSLAKHLRSLAKLLRSLAKIFVSSQNFCVLSQRYLHSLPVEFGLFTLQLAVVHTAPYVHNGAAHRVLF